MTTPADPSTVVAVVPTSHVDAIVGLGSIELDDGQRERRDALHHASDRDDFTAARALARLVLSAAEPTTPPDAWVIDQRCARCGGPHGKPVVLGRSGLSVSWAHTRGLVAAAVSTHDVGVDVEWCVPGSPPPFEPEDPPPATLAQWLRWTRMESLVKRGDGDLDDGLRWPLAGPAAPDGVPISAMLPGRRGVLTDVVGPDQTWAASVAADSAARRLLV